MRNILIAISIAGITFVLASLGFIATSSLLGSAFGGIFRMFMYHSEHPFQYIGVVAFTFGILGAFWLCFCGGWAGWNRWISILATILLTIVVASVPGGILWKIHDMQAGWFTKGGTFWSDLAWGAREGLLVGWLVILVSIPYNLLGLWIGAILLHVLPGIVARFTKQCEQDVTPNA